MKIVFATHNRHKVEEVQAVLGPSFQLVTAAEAGITAEIPENSPPSRAMRRKKRVMSMNIPD